MFRTRLIRVPLLTLGLVVALPWGCGSEEQDGPGELGGDERDDEGASQARADGGRDAGRDAGRDTQVARDARTNEPAPVNPADGTCAAIQQDAPVSRGKVDVLWVVDNSPSMFDKILQVQANISTFYSSIDASGADLHIVSISGVDLALGTPLETDAEKHRFAPALVWSKTVYPAILSSYPSFADFMRPDASTHIVAVTDDEDLMTGAEFRAQMEALLGHPFTLHAIVAQEFGCGSAIGNNYMSLAQETSGEQLSICSSDWTQVFGDLTSAVVSAVPLPCSYALADATMSDQQYDPTQVQVLYTPADATEQTELPKSTSAAQCADKLGWHYDDEANPTKIELCPAACDLVKAGGSMDIALGCEPTIFL